MPKILIAECKQEVSTFNPAPSSYDNYRVVIGAEMIEYHRNVDEEIGGALSVFDEVPDLEIIPACGASSNTSGGVLTAESFQRLCDDFLGAIKNAGPVDAVYFCLHGAMQADGENDPEGFLLAESRKILGEGTPFIVSLDLHGICTDKMLSLADAVVVYHTYPHVDFFETGARAAQLLLKVLNGAKPVMARVKIPVLARGDEMITDSGAVSQCIQYCQEIEASEEGLAAATMWGNPFTDVPELRSNAIVVTDGNEDLAKQHAIEIANRFWANHEKMQVPLTSLEDAVRQAAEIESGTVVMMDAADATSSGASGDSNAIVREVLRQDYRGTILSPVVDPAAARMAFEAGVGGTIRTTFGGACDPARFEPLELEVRVRSLSDGKFCSESFGWHWDAGDTAVVEANNITLLVGTHPVSLFDRSWFWVNGMDPKRFDIVVVKSPHCEHQMFHEWCAKLINVDAPGSTSANVKSLGHTICERPLFPLDEGVTFEAVADVFR